MKKIIKLISLTLGLILTAFLVVSCSKKTLNFSMSDLTVTFDNQIHSLKINEEIPEGIEVIYENNDQVNAGEYLVTANISDLTDKYQILTPKISAKLIINKADYDMNQVTFNDKNVPFDGEMHKIEISGELPEGVSVSYQNNTLTEIGTIKATAQFTHNNSNYNVIKDMTANLTIYNDGSYLPVYFVNEGKEIKKLVKKGDIIKDIPELVEKPGYKCYWNYDFTKPVTTILRISATYEIINYKINYHLPEGVINSSYNPASYNINFNNVKLEAPISNYHNHFDGFYLTPDYKEESLIESIDQTLLRDLDIYAKFIDIKIKDYTKFNLNEDGLIPVLSYKTKKNENFLNLSEMLLIDENLELYISNDLEGKDIIDDNIEVTNLNNVYYAHVTDGKYTTTYQVVITKEEYVNYSFLVDGVIVNAGEVVLGSIINEYYNFEKTGYTLLGYKISGSDKLVEFPYKITENTTFIAVFEANTYTITYDFNGGTYETNKQIVKYDEELNLYIPEKSGYEFVGYLLDGMPFNETRYNIDSDITLVADYKQIEFLVSYYYKDQLLLTDKAILNKEYLIKETINENYYFLSYDLLGKTVYPNKTILYEYENDLNLYVNDKVLVYNNFSLTEGLNNEYYISAYYGEESIIEIPHKILYNDQIRIVTGIADYAFTYNEILTEVVIEEGIRIIGNKAFYNCHNLRNVYMASSVTHLGNYVFANSVNLENVKLSENLEYIGNYLFNNTSIETIELPDSLLDLNSNTFLDCKALKNVKLPNNLEYIGDNAFKNCIALESIILPDTLKDVGVEVFSNCTNLIEVSLPDSLYKISEYMFSDCINLIKVNLPKELRYFGNYCFKNCSKLTEFVLPDDLRHCYRVIFEGIPTSIYNEYENGYYLGTKDNPYKFFITLKENLASNVIFHHDTKIISGFAFINCPNIKELVVPEGIEFINNGIFEGNLGIERVILPESLTGIGPHLFNGCTNLKYVQLPKTNKFALPSSVFINCKSLEEITIYDNITEIGYALFEGCTSLKKVVLPETITKIDKKAFKNCSSLTSINIPKNIKELPYEVFYGCTSLVDFNLEDTNIDVIDKNAILNLDSSLYNVYNGGLYYGKNDNPYYYLVKGSSDIHLDTKVIVGGAFKNSNITNIIIPEGVTHINGEAFSECKNLTYVQFPKSLKYIGYRAFYGCDMLESLTLDENIEEICDQAFYGNYRINNISINSIHLKLGNNIFSDFRELNNIYINGIVEYSEYTFASMYTNSLNFYNGIYYISSTTNPYHTAVRISDAFANKFELHKDCVNINYEALKYSSLALK